MADLKFLGRILGAIGGLIMILFGFVVVIREFGQIAVDLGILETNIIGTLSSESWLISAAIMIVCGVIALVLYRHLGGKKKGELILYGIIYIVLGLVAGTLGGLLAILGGIILVIDYFI